MDLDEKARERAQDIAVKIYVALVARNTEITQESVKLNASAANIATLSLRLAEAFLQSENDARDAKVPSNKHVVQADDIAKWTTKA